MSDRLSRKLEERKKAYEEQKQARVAALEARKAQYIRQREEIEARKARHEMERKRLLKLGLLGISSIKRPGGGPTVGVKEDLMRESKKRRKAETPPEKKAKAPTDLDLEQV